MIVVADTSPINYLVLLEQVEILRHFYDRVLVPPFVWQELRDVNTPIEVRKWLAHPPAWLEMHPLKIMPDSSLGFLDRGERETIALAVELRADRLIADETLARNEARRRNLSVIDTLGVLRNAAGANLLSLPEALSKLQRTTFFVAPDLIQSLLEEEAVRRKRISKVPDR